MIKKFQNFNVSLHEHNDIDPFDEEDWNEPEILDDKDLIKINLRTPLKVGDRIYDFENVYYGVIIEVINDGEYRVNKDDGKVQWISKIGFDIFGYKLKMEKQFEHNDIDPFDEEEWEEPLNDEDLTKITTKTLLKIGDVIYTPKNAYLGVITNIVKMGKYYGVLAHNIAYYVVNTGIKNINSSLWTFYTFGYKIKKK